MPVAGLDHVAITVANVDVTVDWYRRVLDAEILYLDLWRAGKLRVAQLQIGASRMNVHPAAAPGIPHAHVPTPGAADLCFRYEGTMADILARLDSKGVAVVEGPIARPVERLARDLGVLPR